MLARLCALVRHLGRARLLPCRTGLVQLRVRLQSSGPDQQHEQQQQRQITEGPLGRAHLTINGTVNGKCCISPRPECSPFLTRVYIAATHTHHHRTAALDRHTLPSPSLSLSPHHSSHAIQLRFLANFSCHSTTKAATWIESTVRWQ